MGSTLEDAPSAPISAMGTRRRGEGTQMNAGSGFTKHGLTIATRGISRSSASLNRITSLKVKLKDLAVELPPQRPRQKYHCATRTPIKMSPMSREAGTHKATVGGIKRQMKIRQLPSFQKALRLMTPS